MSFDNYSQYVGTPPVDQLPDSMGLICKQRVAWLKRIKKDPILSKNLAQYVIKAQAEGRDAFNFFGTTFNVELAYSVLADEDKAFIEAWNYQHRRLGHMR